MQPEAGFSRVYAVPRLRKCISSLFLKLMNIFGNEGGFDLALKALLNSEGLTPSPTATSEIDTSSSTQTQPVNGDISGLFT